MARDDSRQSLGAGPPSSGDSSAATWPEKRELAGDGNVGGAWPSETQGLKRFDAQSAKSISRSRSRARRR
jgi:hypothetical protein